MVQRRTLHGVELVFVVPLGHLDARLRFEHGVLVRRIELEVLEPLDELVGWRMHTRQKQKQKAGYKRRRPFLCTRSCFCPPTDTTVVRGAASRTMPRPSPTVHVMLPVIPTTLNAPRPSGCAKRQRRRLVQHEYITGTVLRSWLKQSISPEPLMVNLSRDERSCLLGREACDLFLKPHYSFVVSCIAEAYN